MEKIKSTSLKVISLLTNITYYFTLIGLVGILVLNILSYTDVLYPKGDNKSEVSINIPLAVELNEVGVYKTDAGLSELILSSDDSKFTFKNPPKNIVRVSVLFLLISLLIMFYLIFIFRKLISNVKKNHIFVTENSKFFKKLGVGTLVLWGVEFITSFIFSLLVGNSIYFDTVQFEAKIDLKIDFTLIIFSLFLIVLSHIFNQGIRLQEEKDLTI